MNINDAIKEYFRRGAKLFYEQTDKRPLNKPFERILALFFHQGKELRNGVFVPLLTPADELPTLSQYRYWYRTKRNLIRFVASHKSSHASDTGERAVLGHLPQMVTGPGFLFEIHVVVANMYLVSMLDRSYIIGRTVIYIILDGCMTLNEFRRLVIECIIEHNLHTVSATIFWMGDMIADGIELYPRDVWIWGIQSRSDTLRVLPIDDVRCNLLFEANEVAQHETSEALGEYAADKGQEGKTAIRDSTVQEAPGALHSQSVFRGVVERFFALDNDKLF